MIGGIDVGGTKVLMVLCEDDGTILWQHQVPSHAGGNPEQALAAYAEELKQVALSRGQRVDSIGVSLPGPVAGGSRLVVAPNLNWHDVRLAPTLSGIPTAYDQDARCATRAEAILGTGRDMKTFVYISVGTGLGAALWLHGEVWRGAGGSAGELGHIRLPGSTVPCGCGKVGCLERTASGHGIERMYEEQTGTHLPGQQVFAHSDAGEETAREVVQRFLDALGWGMAVISGLVNPEGLVLGGGFVERFDTLKGPLWDIVRRDTMAPSLDGLRLLPAELGPESAAIGAALLGRRG